MGRLSSFRYRDIIRILKAFGFEFHRQAAGSHEIWFNPITNRYTTIPNHSGDMPRGNASSDLKASRHRPGRFFAIKVNAPLETGHGKFGQISVTEQGRDARA